MSKGRITNADIRTEQDLVDLGADKTYLPHSSKIYIDKSGIEKRLDEYLVRNYFEATRDPEDYDDSTQNFEVGSRWVNTLTERLFTCVNAAPSGAVWTQGGGGVETFTVISEAENREDNESYDLIYVVSTETIYRYSASGLSGIPTDDMYILGDTYNIDGRWKGIAGKYIYEKKSQGNFSYTHEINSSEVNTWNTDISEIPEIEAFFWDDSENAYNLLSAASLSIDISTSGGIQYDTTSFVFDSNDKIILKATYTTVTLLNVNEYDSYWVEVASINNAPLSGYHQVSLPEGFHDNPAGYSLTINDGTEVYPADIASRLSFTVSGTGTRQVNIDTEGLDSTDKFRLVCSKSARPTGTLARGIVHDAIVGTSESVFTGFATHTSLQSAIDSLTSGGRILLLVSVTENITFSNNNISVEGKGRSVEINGSVTFDGNGNTLRLVRGIGNIVLNGDINFVSETWLAPSYTISDNGTGNYYNIIEEI